MTPIELASWDCSRNIPQQAIRYSADDRLVDFIVGDAAPQLR
jgi:hypothetical protein